MKRKPFQLGQIWRRNGCHGLLLSSEICEFLSGKENVYNVFILESGTTTEWFESNMLISIKVNTMELVA